MAEVSVTFKSKPYGIGVCSDLLLPFVCQIAEGGFAENSGILPGMRFMTIEGKDVSNDPPSYVLQMLKDAKVPVTIGLRLDTEWVLSQPPCACVAWNNLRANYALKAAMADQELAVKSTRDDESYDGGGEIKSPGSFGTDTAMAESESQTEVKQSRPTGGENTQMVVVDCTGLRLRSTSETKAEVLGRFDFGMIIIGDMDQSEDPNSNRFRVTRPYPGYISLSEGMTQLAGRALDLPTLESVIAASNLPRGLLLGENDQTLSFSDLGSFLAYWDSVAKHLVPVFAKICTPNFRLSIIEIVVDYLKNPSDCDKFRFDPPDALTGWGTQCTGVPQLLLFYSAGITADLVSDFGSELRDLVTSTKRSELGIHVVRLGTDAPKMKEIKGVTYHDANEGSFSHISLHKSDSRTTWHMLLIDQFGNIIKSTWPQVRLLLSLLKDRFRLQLR